MNKLYGLIILALALSSCGSSDTDEANALLNDARQALAENAFAKGKALIDSLRETYPKEVDARRAALALMDSLELGEAQAELAKADSVCTFKKFEVEDLKKEFVFEKQEKYQTTGYYVTRDYAGSKAAFDFFCEVEEGGTLLAVNINRSRGIQYDFTPIEIDMDSDMAPDLERPLSEREKQSYESCFRLARSIQQLNAAQKEWEKCNVKVRFFERKMKQ